MLFFNSKRYLEKTEKFMISRLEALKFIQLSII
jgi:hypothetical protein